jgi:hypothetical protein
MEFFSSIFNDFSKMFRIITIWRSVAAKARSKDLFGVRPPSWWARRGRCRAAMREPAIASSARDHHVGSTNSLLPIGNLSGVPIVARAVPPTRPQTCVSRTQHRDFDRRC